MLLFVSKLFQIYPKKLGFKTPPILAHTLPKSNPKGICFSKQNVEFGEQDCPKIDLWALKAFQKQHDPEKLFFRVGLAEPFQNARFLKPKTYPKWHQRPPERFKMAPETNPSGAQKGGK